MDNTGGRFKRRRDMSADTYMLVRKGVPSGRWYVQMGQYGDEDTYLEAPVTPKTPNFGHLEDALREAAVRETEYGIVMGEDVPDPEILT